MRLILQHQVKICGAALLLATLTPFAHAQARTDALRAADPATEVTAAPQRTLAPTSLPDTPALSTEPDRVREIWLQANDRVGQFPRGHIDLLRWEARNPEPGKARARMEGQPTAPLAMTDAVRLSLRQRPDLFTRPTMNALETRRVELAATDHVLQVRQAWLGAVAARQSLDLLNATLEAARTGTDLGQRMVQAGNWPQARMLREQLVQSTAEQAVARAHMAADAASELLARLLGLWSGGAVAQMQARLPSALPAVPVTLPAMKDLETEALRNQPALDLQRQEAERAIVAIRPERLQAWAIAADAALAAMVDSPQGRHPAAPHINDLFLSRDHALERAVEAEASLLQIATERRSKAREAWGRLLSSHALALHTQNVLVKLTKLMEQETLLRYNGMLQSSWELLASARERNQALDAAVQAQHDFWSAQVDWQALLAGGDYTSPASGGGEAGMAAAPQGH